jgi:hypothetical protein
MSAYLLFLILMASVLLLVVVPSSWYCRRWIRRFEPASRLAAFRILYALVLLCELLQLIYCESLIYDRVPWLVDNNMPVTFALYIWVVLTICLAVGYQTRFVTVMNFALNLVVFSASHRFEYHVDYAYTAINFLLMLAPVSAAYSIDARLRSGRRRRDTPTVLVPAVYSQLLVWFGVGIVYADSCYWKLTSWNWTHGLGLFAYASHPAFTWYDFSAILDSRFLSLGCGWLTLAFEILFIPLFCWHRSRYALAVIGIGLHLGILMVFPIPWFGLCMACLYVLVWPVKYQTPPSNDASVWDEGTAFGRLTASHLAWLIALLLTLQFNATVIGNSQSMLRSVAGDDLTLEVDTVSRSVVNNFSRPLFGIVTHPVFMDVHLQLARQQYRIIAQNQMTLEQWVVPITTEAGLAHPLTSGRLWVNWMFRVAPYMRDNSSARREFQRLLLFWTIRQGKTLNGTVFSVQSRPVELAQDWQSNLLTRRRAVPWTHRASVVCKQGAFQWISEESPEPGKPGDTEESKPNP